jgi:hypothetical protein
VIATGVSLRPLGDGLYGASSAIRDDGDVPVLVLCEPEAIHNHAVRQPDSDTFRFWEMAGASHVSVDERARLDAIDARDGIVRTVEPATEPNTVHWDYIRDAALRHLVRWIDTGTPPASIPPIDIDPGLPAVIRRDEHGNALGGLRLPDVGAPNGTNTGGNTASPMAALAGTTTPLTPEQLHELYGNIGGYVQAWNGAVDELGRLDLVPSHAWAALRRWSGWPR